MQQPPKSAPQHISATGNLHIQEFLVPLKSSIGISIAHHAQVHSAQREPPRALLLFSQTELRVCENLGVEVSALRCLALLQFMFHSTPSSLIKDTFSMRIVFIRGFVFLGSTGWPGVTAAIAVPASDSRNVAGSALNKNGLKRLPNRARRCVITPR